MTVKEIEMTSPDQRPSTRMKISGYIMIAGLLIFLISVVISVSWQGIVSLIAFGVVYILAQHFLLRFIKRDYFEGVEYRRSFVSTMVAVIICLAVQWLLT